ncbi:MAG TPA: SDR family NAD(P)-dependent oxidoreductase [Gemmatimonadaceae bacterium]|jgi:NAD(P)-dependent dehydrogenase (short-subunit alcohol dehydrogenase family)
MRLPRFVAPMLLAVASSISAQTRAPRAVLVTGASSGIGRKITEQLASHGFFVYAGARSPKDLEDLGKIAGVQAVRLDVTSAADISAAVETVRKGGRGLYGVVNNAGVVVAGPLVELEEKELDYIFNVNIYGPYRITKAFAPMLIDAKGRVVNISSLNGIVASPMIGAYSMSKHAIEAFGDGLAAEMRPLGVRVSLIEPGNYGTEIGKNLLAHMDTAAIKGSRFAAQLRATVTSMSQFEKNPPPDDVAEAVFDAFTNERPRMRYLVVPVEAQARIAIRKKMDDLVEMNEGQMFRYDRDALVKMLDESIARAKAQRP